MTVREAFDAWFLKKWRRSAMTAVRDFDDHQWLAWQASRQQALEDEKSARLKAWETAWDACRKQTISECEGAARKELARCGTHLYPDDVEAVAAAIRSLTTTGDKA